MEAGQVSLLPLTVVLRLLPGLPHLRLELVAGVVVQQVARVTVGIWSTAVTASEVELRGDTGLVSTNVVPVLVKS